MKKLIWMLVIASLALTVVAVAVLAVEKDSPPLKTGTTEIDQQTEAARTAPARRASRSPRGRRRRRAVPGQ